MNLPMGLTSEAESGDFTTIWNVPFRPEAVRWR